MISGQVDNSGGMIVNMLQSAVALSTGDEILCDVFVDYCFCHVSHVVVGREGVIGVGQFDFMTLNSSFGFSVVATPGVGILE